MRKPLTKEHKAKVSAGMKRWHAERIAAGLPNPGAQAAVEPMKAHWADPDKKARTRKLMSANTKKAWADPVKHAERLARYNATCAANGTSRGKKRKEETAE